MLVRICTINLEVGNDVEANLRKIEERIAEAAVHGTELVVFPEFCNHACHYVDRDDAWRVAIDVPGPFTERVAAAARAHRIWVMVNATTREDPTVQKVFDTNLLFGPDGNVHGRTQKQVLMASEVGYLDAGETESAIVHAPFGRIGMYSCMDGLVPETTRCLVLNGAQILLNSLNSWALDEASLHVPVRAAENRVWLVASNKAGPLRPVAEMPAVAARLGMAEHLLHGAGHSQVVSPDGEIVVQAQPRVEDMVYADIAVALADRKRLPSGNDVIADRRPECYQILSMPYDRLPLQPAEPAPAAFPAAAIQIGAADGPDASLQQAIQLIEQAAGLGARLVVLPELFPFQRPLVDPPSAAAFSKRCIAELADIARRHGLWLVADLVEAAGEQWYHTAFLFSGDGSIHASYRQVHVAAVDRAWAASGDGFTAVDTPLGRIGMLTGYDGLFPESARVLTCLGADVIAYPACWETDWEPRWGVVERMTENHLSLVVANRLDSPVKRGSMVVVCGTYPPVPMVGYLNPNLDPAELPAGEEGVLVQTIAPANSRRKEFRPNVDIIRNRRPELYAPIVGRTPIAALTPRAGRLDAPNS